MPLKIPDFNTRVTEQSSSTEDFHLFLDFHLFNLLPAPKRDDWLACHNEIGQSFTSFSRAARNRISQQRDTIYILPLSFEESPVPKDILESLASFSSIFFSCKTSLMKSTKVKVPTRLNEYTDTLQVGWKVF